MERGFPDFAVVSGAFSAVVSAFQRPSGLGVCPVRLGAMEYASGRADGAGGGRGGAGFAVISTSGSSGSAIRADEGANFVLGCVGEGLDLGGEAARPGQGGRCMTNVLGLMGSEYQ